MGQAAQDLVGPESYTPREYLGTVEYAINSNETVTDGGVISGWAERSTLFTTGLKDSTYVTYDATWLTHSSGEFTIDTRGFYEIIPQFVFAITSGTTRECNRCQLHVEVSTDNKSTWDTYEVQGCGGSTELSSSTFYEHFMRPTYINFHSGVTATNDEVHIRFKLDWNGLNGSGTVLSAGTGAIQNFIIFNRLLDDADSVIDSETVNRPRQAILWHAQSDVVAGSSDTAYTQFAVKDNKNSTEGQITPADGGSNDLTETGDWYYLPSGAEGMWEFDVLLAFRCASSTCIVSRMNISMTDDGGTTDEETHNCTALMQEVASEPCYDQIMRRLIVNVPSTSEDFGLKIEGQRVARAGSADLNMDGDTTHLRSVLMARRIGDSI